VSSCIEIGSFESVHSFSKYSVHKLVTDERTDRLTDERTGREHYASGQTRLEYRKKQYIPLTPHGIAFVCLILSVLSATTKFFVHLFGEGEARGGVKLERGGHESSKKLRCRRETARCFLSLNISLSHSRSLKVIENGSFGFLFAFCITTVVSYIISFHM